MVAVVACGALVLTVSTPVLGQVRPSDEITRLKAVPLAPLATQAGTAKCPAGYRAITGGAYIHKPRAFGDATAEAAVTASAPLADATGWYASGSSFEVDPVVLTITVQCLVSSTFPAYHVRQREVVVDAGRPGNALLTCPLNDRVVMGGAVWHRPGHDPVALGNATITGSGPDLSYTHWSVEGYHTGSSPVDMRVIAMCLPSSALGAGYKVETVVHAPGPLQPYADYLTCPGTTHVLGGGAFWTYPTDDPDRPATDIRNVFTGISAGGNGQVFFAAGTPSDARFTMLGMTVAAICVDG
jgi:hypothetical protein